MLDLPSRMNEGQFAGLCPAPEWPLYALWPFTRLVHAWSIPVQYLRRPYILYRPAFRPSADGRPGALKFPWPDFIIQQFLSANGW